jgi:hypothetical protein
MPGEGTVVTVGIRPVPVLRPTTCPQPGPGASWVRRSGPVRDHRVTSGSHCSGVWPRTGQKATATPQPTPDTAITSPPIVGLARSRNTARTSDVATAAIWPPRQPAMIPRRSSGENR